VGVVKRGPTPPGPITDLFARLDDLHARAGRPSMREIARQVGRGKISTSTVHNVFRSPRVPRWNYIELIVRALGGDQDREEFLDLWQAAWRAENADDPLRTSTQNAAPSSDQTENRFSGTWPRTLLLRIYIPADRLYAAEAHKLLSLFREWLVTARGRRIRQSGYSTASGEVFEFYAEDSVQASEVKADLQEEFDSFSGFLWLCSKDPTAATDLLASTGLGRASSMDLVARFGKEARRLQIDLRQERERRILILRHSLEGEMLDTGADLTEQASSQIATLLERLIPGPSAPESLTLLTAHRVRQLPAPVTVNINPQIISAMESTIIQNVHGAVNLAPQAKELLVLVDRFGGREKSTLQSAVYELEDSEAPPEARSAARLRLKKFLGELTGTARNIGVDLLQKYLEHKVGL